MPGTNLTRDEAQTRAGLLSVESYSVDLDLTVSDKVFESTTVLRFTCGEPGASTFADLVGATIHEVVLNGEKLDAFDVYRDSRIRLVYAPFIRSYTSDRFEAEDRLNHVFDLEGRPKATRAYAWSSPIEGSDKRRFYATSRRHPLPA